MPTYPSNYYGPGLGTNFNNNVTRRLGVRDRVGWGASRRFGGQFIEDLNVPAPYQGTIIDAVAACQQLVNELNLISPVLPDMGTPVILSSVGVATNRLLGPVGAAVSYIGGQANANVLGGVTTTEAAGLLIDGVAIATGMRVLYFGLQTSSLNGVYTVGFGKTTTTGSGGLNYYFLQRAPDLFYPYQFVKPKAFVVNNGINLKGSVLSLQSDAFEVGPTFTVAYGTSVASAALSTAAFFGNPINLVQTYYSPLGTSGINATVLGTQGAGNTSLIYPTFNPASVLNTGEYDFLAQASEQKFMYLRNRARRLAFQIFKMRENYTPFVSSYQTDVVVPIGVANTQYNIGFSTLNNLPPQSKYPSSYNRGF
jgi:hypothetical protein